MSSAPVATANKSFLMAHSFLYSRGSTHQRGRRCTRKKISKLLEPGLFFRLARARGTTNAILQRSARRSKGAMRLLNLHVRKEMQTRSFSASLTASSQETMRDASAGTAEQKTFT